LTINYLIIGTILVLLTSIAAITNAIIAAPEDKIDCDASPDHPFCNGKRGRDGFIFCSLKTDQDQQMSCWDDLDGFAEDDPLIHCAQDPETKDECKLTEDEEGMMN
jgi:hypothetical protein